MNNKISIWTSLDVRILNEAQLHAFVDVKAGFNTFISGGCMTGKTMLATILQRQLPGVTLLSSDRQADTFEKPISIHDFMQWSLVLSGAALESHQQKLRQIKCLVIDHISTMRADQLDRLDAELQTARKNTLPFGGVQMVLFADFCLPAPTVDLRREQDVCYVEKYRDRRYAFEAFSFSGLAMQNHTLTEYYYAGSSEQLEAVKAIRLAPLLATEAPNRLYDAFRTLKQTVLDPNLSTQILSSTHSKAISINMDAVSALPGRGKSYHSIQSGDVDALYVPRLLHLKPGAPVRFTQSLPCIDVSYGDMATVLHCHSDMVKVIKDDGTAVLVKTANWQNTRYSADGSKRVCRQVIGNMQQIPLSVAYALLPSQTQGRLFEQVQLRENIIYAPFLYACMRLSSGFRAALPQDATLRTPKDTVKGALFTAQMAQEASKLKHARRQSLISQAPDPCARIIGASFV